MSDIAVEEHFSTRKVHIDITGRETEGRLALEFRITSRNDCVLHWGLSRRRDPSWQAPPESAWPPATVPFDRHAVQSACQAAGGQGCVIRINLDLPCLWDSLAFVLYSPRDDRWLHDGNKDFRVRLPRRHDLPSPQEALAKATDSGDWLRRHFDLGGGETLAAGVREQAQGTRVILACDAEPPLVLHWGLAGKFRHQWQLPPKEYRPRDSTEFDSKALHTPFTEREGLRWLTLDFPASPAQGINFVLYQPETGHWIKAGGRDMYLPLAPETAADHPLGSERAPELAERIIGAEMGRGSWTLMHRFNLCYELLEGVEADPDALSLLFAWLRFSAIRQLDWQRNYNTKPRELSHAQERLTQRLAGIYGSHGSSRPWVRLMLSTLGRGGDGQKVRDEILNIMHRHHIKEVHGHFLEEWHQKLHNNTTPDDIVICEAYLAFLHSDGDLEKFYATLERGGVSRARLRSFERPIRTDPEFYPDKRGGLSWDFEHFLHILKSVHSGTDLDTAAGAARGVLDDALNGRLNTLYDKRQQGAAVRDQVETITALREDLAGRISHREDTRALREMLYLDLALEQVLRSTLEQQTLGELDVRTLTDLVWMVLRNLSLGAEADEFRLCSRHLEMLRDDFRPEGDWALHAKSVTDRAGRVVARWSEALYTGLQPKAEYLGEAFEADAWTLPLFSEEVIRGGAGFMLSLLLRRLDPLLRDLAGLGGWQVISPAQTSGRVRVVDSLRAVQAATFAKPTVLVSDAVAGDEEIPDGVTSVITCDSPDLVSHVAVRARNSRVLFATCYDSDRYGELKDLEDRELTLRVSPAGDVEYQTARGASTTGGRQTTAPALRRRAFSRWAVGQDGFDDEILGGKSNNLQTLRGKLPDWIGFPASMALPFGAFEQTLAAPENQGLAEQLTSLLNQVPQSPETGLPEVRRLLQGLAAPGVLRDALETTWHATGLPPTDWDLIWGAVKKVWASKWNERAWYSRNARGIDHDDLMMAVLIQQVIAADYAFVIHTVNPITGRDDEIYAEVVPGLGETLVGNYPGRALSFACRKADLSSTLRAYPGKSIGLYGSGVIFRSDSNGEDLEHYAGAGLYDSYLAEPPRQRLLDYSDEALVWNVTFRDEMLRKIARIGLEVEQACGSAQDIEGAVQQGEYYLVQTRPQVGL